MIERLLWCHPQLAVIRLWFDAQLIVCANAVPAHASEVLL